ncbi:hypothetical protein RB195_000566 [Necator americanus]|uniref:Uncharacterized protein n=1 Tax=Necator americanus TaxID=51031 RepID=A0ABR1DBR1_NECAM
MSLSSVVDDYKSAYISSRAYEIIQAGTFVRPNLQSSRIYYPSSQSLSYFSNHYSAFLIAMEEMLIRTEII